ncbi:MAG: DUF6353 family protein [Lachnospiraceae bacterium]|nr:DUF6353 family protein [Lachnospiraceae bacterium]
MKVNALIKSAGLAANKLGFKLQKKSPEILIVTGVIGVVAGTICACKATTKVSEIADVTRDTVKEINEAAEKGVTKAGKDYSEDDKKKDLVITYTHAAIGYVKLYAPAALTMGVSLACIITSHRMLKKRNIALAAAYTTLDKSFKDYRSRVIDRFGEEIEKEIRYNIKAQEVEKTVTDENGKEKKVKETVNTVASGWNPADYSPYARLFDSTNIAWKKDPSQNSFYLKAIQAQANDRLRARGHLFLNEVYELLNYPLTDYGQVVGWVYDLKDPIGDNFVDFGIFEVHTEDEVFGDPISGFVLDFNVVGDITSELANHQY